MNMRERMEAAILGSFILEDWRYVEGKTGDDEIVVDGHIRLSKLVDAVLDAMKEPTPEVAKAGLDVQTALEPMPPVLVGSFTVWQAMINAIKAGK